MFEIKRYNPSLKKTWDQYVKKARNSTFLFYRDYMDYHSDRFHDHSLLFFKGNHLHSILPAHEKEEATGGENNSEKTKLFCSHLGLTYGGLIMDKDVTAADVVELFKELNTYLKAQGFKRAVYKPVPWVYHQLPSEEDLYALYWQCHARIIQRDMGTTIFMQEHLRWRKDRRRRLKKALEAGVEVKRTDDFTSFWKVLDDNLQERHHVHPVHTLAEIELLHCRFPENIVQYNAYYQGKVVAGMTFYISRNMVHGQYCSSNDTGKDLGAVDAIYDKVMYHDYADYKYLDFGRSTEGIGDVLNEGLIAQKEGFGGRGVIYDTYEWDI